MTASSNGFRIVLEFGPGLTREQRKIFHQAARRWQQVIQGSSAGNTAAVAGPGPLVLRIKVSAPKLDGPGKVLGRAGPTYLREWDGLPVEGIMEFDTADLTEMQQAGTLKDVILHEMGHVLGLGTLWIKKGVLRGAGTNNPEYVGVHGMREYATLHQCKNASSSLQGVGVTKAIPVANTGGPGTAEGHWRENIFDTELMTGYAEESGAMPLSRLTIAALDDLGYLVDYSQADAYVLPHANGGGATTIKPYCKARFPQLQSQPTPRKRSYRKYMYGCCGCCTLLIVIIVILVFALGLDCDDSFTENVLDPIRLYDSIC